MTEKKKWFMSHKRRDKNNKRDQRRKISFSITDLEKLQKKADKVNLPFAEYVYCVVMEKELVVHNSEVSDTLRKIAGEATNLNQIAYYYHISGQNQAMEDRLKEIINKFEAFIAEDLQYINQNKKEE